MSGKIWFLSALIAISLGTSVGLVLAQEPYPQEEVSIQAALSAAFTYQGQLKSSGEPVSGRCDFQFSLWDASSGGTQVGVTQTKVNVSVSSGYFTIPDLDFGSDAFQGDARWLSIAVRCPAGGGSYTALSPRQALTATPYALAMPGLWTQQNAVSPNLIGGYRGNSVISGVVGATIGGGGQSGYINRVTDNYGTVGGGSGNTASGNATVGGGYQNTASGEDATIGGGWINIANGGFATIGGGYTNTASNYYTTIGGGSSNTASGESATVSGGRNNTASDAYTTIGGGVYNTAVYTGTTVSGGWNNTASRDYATVGGGALNTASGPASTISGGWSNLASGESASIGGGDYNVAGAAYAAIAGGGPTNPNDPTNTNNRVTDDYGAIGGGGWNRAGNEDDDTANKPYATVGGGFHNIASGGSATVGGGELNTASGNYATVGGGELNTASGIVATVGGGVFNTASGTWATIGGGYLNIASADYATIAGGGPANPNDPTNTNNRVTDDYGTIGGGGWNRAGNEDDDTTNSLFATVGGGGNNTASDDYATVGGGDSNTANSTWATVGGGWGNTASGTWATVGGGLNNTASVTWATIGGGWGNTASGENATVGGGYSNEAGGASTTVGGGWNNTANGNAGTVPGGADNIAEGAYSFAAGAHAYATHPGAFVWSSAEATSSWGNDTFTVRAHGGARVYTAPGTGTGVQLASGGGSWSSLSDRAAKENFETVDGREVLERLASIPIETWNLKSQDPSIRHIGPMAQDFYAAFQVGEDDRHISTVDADGVALAAIQGLYSLVQEQGSQIAQLEQENLVLEKRLDDLEGRIASLEQGGNASGGRQPLGQSLQGAVLLLFCLGSAWAVHCRTRGNKSRLAGGNGP